MARNATFPTVAHQRDRVSGKPSWLLDDEDLAAAPGGAKGKPDKGGGGGDSGDGGGGKPSKSGSAPTDIQLSNGTVDENSAGGTVIGSLTATDSDKGERHRFTLLDNTHLFTITNGNTLVVAEGAVLDFEQAQFQTITVQVTDKQGNTYTDTLTIDLNDLPELPNEAPTDIEISQSTVSEAASNGTEVGRLTAVDPNVNDSFTWTLLDDAGGRFALSGDRIVVADGTLIDFEQQGSHDITVRVTDSGGLSYDEVITIAVADVIGGRSDQPYYVQAVTVAYGADDSRRWPDGDPADAPTTITYSLMSDFAAYYDPLYMPYTSYTTEAVAFSPLTSAQTTVIHQLVAELEELVSVDFVEVASAGAANVSFGSYYMDSSVGAFAYYADNNGSEGTRSGDVWLNSRYDRNPTTSENGGADWARQTIAHELGHAMGLKHPGDYNAGGGGTAGPYLYGEEDSFKYTTMSYNTFSGQTRPLDFQLYDVAALQYLYGANDTTRTGDDVYTFQSNATDTIWDAGGYDTIDASNFSSSVEVSLVEGGFSSLGATDNVAVAFGAKIEAAVGGAGNDRLVGNDLNNSLTGGAGSDTFAFLADWGIDHVADYDDGLDLLDFSYSGMNLADLQIGSEGTDALVSFFGSDDMVRLANVDSSLLDASDFLFATV